jgi:hypothetical protein
MASRRFIASSYVAVATDGHLKVEFTADDGDGDGATETVLGAAVPMDVVLNGEVVTEGFALPDDGDPGGVREYVVTLPGSAVRQGVNVLEIRHAGADEEGDNR